MVNFVQLLSHASILETCMYSFEPTDDQRMLMEAARKFASSVLRAKFREADEQGEPDSEWTRAGWQLGLLPGSIPEPYGGFGERSALTGSLAAEELAWGSLAGALTLTAPNLIALPILLSGSRKQREKYLPGFCGGNYVPGSAALMEPRYDFDPQHLTTRAEKTNGKFVLCGTKVNVPFAAESPLMLVFAAEEGRTGGFLVERGTAGLSVRAREQNMGMKALPLYTVELERCEVPPSMRLGEEDGCDFQVLLNSSRVGLSSMALGVARAAYEYALDYATKRRAFGEAIGQRQAIAFMLAEMITDIEAARLMVWEAAWLLDHGKDAAREAYLARNFTDDMVLSVADRAVQILGGHGYIRDYPVELWLRDARGFAVMEGLTIV
jgi:alkylation response protein AidB-like acyl-CoA dehydrogenase